jgi:hypothetical protein
MAGRAEKLGGEFRLSPAEGGGTELEWRVPIPAVEDHEGAAARPASSQGRYPLR